MRTRIVLAAALVIALVAAGSAVGAPPGATLEFRISFVSNVRSDPATGRIYVIVSSDAKPQPRFQVDILGPPFWGKDVSEIAAGQQMTIDTGTDVYGYPLTSVDQLPDGDYTVQAFLNVYTTFTRSDGSVVQLHMPYGDGGYFLDSPGNLYSAPVQMHLSPSAGPVNLILHQAITPSDPVPNGGTCQQGNPKSSPHVKHVKIKSQMLTKYWGLPMYIAANVLLPEGYSASANAGVRYPVVFLQGHFPSGNPFGFKESLANKFSQWWASNSAPRVIVVEFRHENPFFDDSYAVNSANLGPYGDAMVKELIPVLERQFRMIGEPWARTLTGGSTGGWEALAQQVFYPTFYGGAWSLCPDPVDFRYHQLVNVHSADNAYFTPYEVGAGAAAVCPRGARRHHLDHGAGEPLGAGARHERALPARAMGRLAGRVRPAGRRGLPGADLGQGDRRHRPRGGQAVASHGHPVVPEQSTGRASDRSWPGRSRSGWATTIRSS